MVQVVFLGGEDHDRRVGHIANFATHMQAALTGQHQVRAREEDVSADFSKETPVSTVLMPSPPLDITDKVRGAWADRLRETSGLFKQYPDVLFSNVALEASTETDYFVSSEGSR